MGEENDLQGRRAKGSDEQKLGKNATPIGLDAMGGFGLRKQSDQTTWGKKKNIISSP